MNKNIEALHDIVDPVFIIPFSWGMGIIVLALFLLWIGSIVLFFYLFPDKPQTSSSLKKETPEGEPVAIPEISYEEKLKKMTVGDKNFIFEVQKLTRAFLEDIGFMPNAREKTVEEILHENTDENIKKFFLVGREMLFSQTTQQYQEDQILEAKKFLYRKALLIITTKKPPNKLYNLSPNSSPPKMEEIRSKTKG